MYAMMGLALVFDCTMYFDHFKGGFSMHMSAFPCWCVFFLFFFLRFYPPFDMFGSGFCTCFTCTPGRVYVCTNIISAMHTILVRNFYIHFGLIFTKRMNEWLMYIFCYLNGCAMNIPNDRLVLIRADIQMHRQQIGVCIQHQIPTLPF